MLNAVCTGTAENAIEPPLLTTMLVDALPKELMPEAVVMPAAAVKLCPAPPKVFTPVNARVPVPVFVRLNAPETTPLTVSVRPEATLHDCVDPSVVKAPLEKFVTAAFVNSMPTLL
jgi:hypothetical protein